MIRVGLGQLASANNLSDVANATTARTNIAAAASSDFTALNSASMPAGNKSGVYWIKDKSAIRAGLIDGAASSSAYWDDANIGLYSVALGNDSKASGTASTALGGETNRSTGDFAITIGDNNLASANWSIAIGQNCTSTGGIAFGGGATVSGGGLAFQTGNSTGGVAFGTSLCDGGALAFGSTSWSTGESSHAMGYGVKSAGFGCTSIGVNNSADGNFPPTDSSFNSLGESSFALGRTSGAGGSTLIANGNASFAMGEDVNAGSAGTAKDNCFAIGQGFSNTTAQSFAVGFGAILLHILGSGVIKLIGLPTADPHVVNQLWKNSGVLTVSAG